MAVLSRLNPGDITIRHHWTGEPVRLHSYRHKGYWYHGRRREEWIMEMLARLIQPGDTVVEVGGHIGYVALWLAKLVGPGHVYVFEPAPNNLKYIEQNIRDKSNVTLVPKGVGDVQAERSMYVEKLTGLNNTFVQPQFVKIDVEGFESEVLQGMRETLRTRQPKLMVEVTRNAPQVWAALHEAGYILFGEDLQVIANAEHLHGNVFGMCPQRHAQELKALGVTVAQTN
jgi:hypothetical protein